MPAPGCLLWQGACGAAAQLSQLYKYWASVWNCNNATNIDIFPAADVISAHVMLLQIKTGQYSVQPPPGLGKQWVDILGSIDSSQHACHLATILSNKLFCCLTHLPCICSCSAELDTSTDCVVMPRTLAVRTHLHLSLQTETKDTNLWVINCFPRMFL